MPPFRHCPARLCPTRLCLRLQSGYTLLELLVVLAIMAALAGVGVQVYGGVVERSRAALARTEMDRIATAIQRFRADTGYWPKEGPFADDTVDETDNPASLSQLRVQPKDDTNNDILPFDRASGTGWNGPYLRELDAVTVSVGNNLADDGSGDPTAGTMVDVFGVGDPFDAAADASGAFAWFDSAGGTIARLGRPYLYFAPDSGAGTNVAGCTTPCLVSLGPNGTYDAGGNDDITVNIAGN